ncbi:hypothetical protein [Streptomyces sp. NPDC058953]|uniref:hypothetical protein n=1 Tax=unclassified Streptomyces TaxID=2593676 RepID=UPI0036AE48C0
MTNDRSAQPTGPAAPATPAGPAVLAAPATPEEDRTETACRICGYDDGDEVFDSGGMPNYVICPCCYNESGIGDDNLGQIRELRGYWVGRGMGWKMPEFRPEGWDVFRQIANIPERWR